MRNARARYIAVAAALIAAGCDEASPGVVAPTLCEAEGCTFELGAPQDPVLRLALTAADEGGLCAAAMPGSVNLLNDTFDSGNGTTAWPANVGYAGDFNGDWYADSGAALFYNPNWGAGGVTLPTMTGFVKFIRIWPATGSTVSVSAHARAELTTSASDTTLVVYFFNASNAVLGIETSNTIRGRTSATLRIDQAAIPAGTVRVGIVPTAYIAAGEQGTVVYEDLRADYLVQGGVTSTALYSDSFTTAGDPAYDDKQPTGWTEYGGDYFVHPTAKHLTLWNPSWSGASLPIDAVVSRRIALTGVAAGAKLSASIFAATTFTDPTSWFDMAVTFDTPTATASARLIGSDYRTLDLHEVAIPAGATGASFHLRTHLGPAETSSLYADDFAVSIVTGNSTPAAAPDSDGDGLANVCDTCPLDAKNDIDGDGVCGNVDNCPTVANPTQADTNRDGYGDACVSPTVSVGSGSTIGSTPVIGSGVRIGSGSTIGNNVTIGRNTQIGRNVIIEDGAVIGESVTIKDNVFIGANARIGNYSVIEESARVGAGTVLGQSVTIKPSVVLGQNLVVANFVVVEDRAQVGNGTQLAQSVTIKKDAVVGANVVVGLYSVVEEGAKIGDRTRIGQSATIKKGAVVGSDVVISDNAVVEESVRVGNFSSIGKGATVKKNAVLGQRVTVRDAKVVAEGQVVPDGATI